MAEIIYRPLTESDLYPGSMQNFQRHQVVTECWRHTPEGLKLLPIAFVDDWDDAKRRKREMELRTLPQRGGIAFGALRDGELLGYIALAQQSPDCPANTLEVLSFHVGEPYRGQGIGKHLFAMAVAEGRRRKMRRLYISSHSAKESYAAYEHLGCRETQDVLASAVEKEPCDIQREYLL